MYKILLDTNVLVDYYLGREPGCSACVQILDMCVGNHALYVSALSLKDVYYLVGATLKRQIRQENGALLDADAASCTQIAWSCVRHAMDMFIVANTGAPECLDAFVCRSLHNGFEDNLVLAAARSIGVDYMVTSDARFAANSPVATLAPEAMARLLDAEAHARRWA